MEILIDNDLSDLHPDNTFIIHLVILCCGLEYCLGSSKSMTFKKLSYIFDNVVKKNQMAFKASNSIVAWDIEGYFRKSLIMAEAGGYIKFLSKAGAVTLQIDDKGRRLITMVEVNKRFESYISLVKRSKYKETDFKSPNIGCDLNEY
ncbi:hypothetical protein H4J56_15020 [Colwellia sp. BRX8-4]|jgi:hypothetical protein|uniref:hypothetical protein n=1 Tax=Colwellia sp. BRX8-4 TaxID=2759836 RepID=UPI0015F6D3D3|nr:hypothetical protein [Colwellia sp. BRX8-4]MBA6372733.1 hypothetical protein [Colwellia sp. BRX8-4]